MQILQDSIIQIELISKESQLTEQNLVQQLKSCSQQQPNIQYGAQKYWTQEQQSCFVSYWIDKITEDPLEICSFDNPLKRKDYFKELSRFITSKLGEKWSKNDQQCKSKFATIKRKLQRKNLLNKSSGRYGFIDYIMTQGKKLKRISYQLEDKMNQLKRTIDTESQYMVLTKKMMDFECSDEVQLKNNKIYGYLKEINQLPIDIM